MRRPASLLHRPAQPCFALCRPAWLSAVLRIGAQLRAWRVHGASLASYDLGGLHSPHSLLSASRQLACMRRAADGWQLDDLHDDFEVLQSYDPPASPPSGEGIHVHGLMLDGARWDAVAGVLIDPAPRVRLAPLPALRVRAVLNDTAGTLRHRSLEI